MYQLHHHGREGYENADAGASFHEQVHSAEKIPFQPAIRVHCFKIRSQEQVEESDVCPSCPSCESPESFLEMVGNYHSHRRDPFAPR